MINYVYDLGAFQSFIHSCCPPNSLPIAQHISCFKLHSFQSHFTIHDFNTNPKVVFSFENKCWGRLVEWLTGQLMYIQWTQTTSTNIFILIYFLSCLNKFFQPILRAYFQFNSLQQLLFLLLDIHCGSLKEHYVGL